MKRAFLLFPVLTLMAARAIAAGTNLNQSVTVERPLNDVIAAMETYYFSTNYHGFAHAVGSTNAVPGVSYSLGIADCTFSSGGLFGGDMVATRVSASSTRLELIVRIPAPTDSGAASSFKRAVSKTLEQVAKIAEGNK